MSGRSLTLSLLVQSMYGSCNWLIKLSLFVLYLKIFDRLRWFKYFFMTSLISTDVFYFVSVIFFFVLCDSKNDQSQFFYLSALASSRCAHLATYDRWYDDHDDLGIWDCPLWQLVRLVLATDVGDLVRVALPNEYEVKIPYKVEETALIHDAIVWSCATQQKRDVSLK
jgi:hypothetical protein